MTSFAFPFRVDHTGGIATVDTEAHVRQLVEQVLFTIPGEHVNRPTFGSAVHNLVFSPNQDAESTAIRFLVQGALQQWLGDIISVESVSTTTEEAKLIITVQYVVRASQQRQIAQFESAV